MAGRLSVTGVITIVAAVVALATLASWAYYAQTDADRVFWGAVDNNLKTTAFTRIVQQEGGGQKASQVTQTFLSPRQMVHAQSTLEQGMGEGTSVVTEYIGTPATDYARFNSITTSQKGADGKDLDFSNVLNVWGEASPASADMTTGQLYNQSIMSILPFGALSADARKALVSQMKSTNVYSYKLVQQQKGFLGRPIYVYEVKQNAEAYIGMYKAYAQSVGLTQFDTLNPSDYAQSDPVSVRITIDGLSRHITSIEYTGQDARTERISAYGLTVRQPEVPANTISIEELQTRLGSVQ